MNKKKEGKITLGMLKGKPVTTSVPLISVRFHANDEQIEEFYAASDDDPSSLQDEPLTPKNTQSEPETSSTPLTSTNSSPLKYLPRLVKRSTSIDITPTTATATSTNSDSSPSDPWRFFSDIKGKITKSVEEKLFEIKARNLDEANSSPLKTNNNNNHKTSKESISVSDSEDLSESSISKTCGIVSTTTEDCVEMSSDEDLITNNDDESSKTDKLKNAPCTSAGLRQRFRMLRAKTHQDKDAKKKLGTEGTIASSNLAKLYEINSDKIEQAVKLPQEETEIESAVEAIEEADVDNEQIKKNIEKQYDNIDVDKNGVVNVKEVSGKELNNERRLWQGPKTVYAPTGFVDLRQQQLVPASKNKFLPFVILLALCGSYFLIHRYSSFLAGSIVGFSLTFTYYYINSILNTPFCTNTARALPMEEIIEVQAVKEYLPLVKYEGWVNELPETYNPHTYHISQTQSVFIRLQGNLLRLSNTRTKVPKRALWNEQKPKAIFTHHRVYNLMGAQIDLLPEGLAKKRHWSKKYPICITLKYESQLDFEGKENLMGLMEEETTKETEKKGKFGFRKKNYKVMSARFSKLTEENEDFDLDSEPSRASTPSPSDHHLDDSDNALVDALKTNLMLDDEDEMMDEWSTFSATEETEIHSPTPVTKLYIFGRTDREKEDWFRRFKNATHKGANQALSEVLDLHLSVSDVLIDNAFTETDYLKYMLMFNKVMMCRGVTYPDQGPSTSRKSSGSKAKNEEDKGNESEKDKPSDLQWLNSLLGRVIFDCLRDRAFQQKIKDRIQRKLASIKLPYFIEGLTVTELSLGQSSPFIHKASRPVIDERGLWIDLDVTYEGLVVLILQTKLNLMKLKQPPQHETFDEKKMMEKSAIYNSDVDDSAESTSDEEMETLENQQNYTAMTSSSGTAPNVLDASGLPVAGLGGSSNASKKFMKMVDRIAESKFFQAATEYRYIKKAMEGVSKTDLRLRVEVKELVGTLVLNIPPPPSDRVWVGFRPTPDLNLSAFPIVGERNISYLRITGWIERKLLQEFQKLLVIPNMEDLIVPIMCQDLPQ